LSLDDVEELKKVFYDHHKSTPEGFYATTHLADKKIRRKLSDAAMEIIGPKASEYFENIELLGGAFISKSPGDKGILPLHQDWNLVDEKLARSYNLWIPLVDMNEQNGTMRVLSESHDKIATFRGPNIRPIITDVWEIDHLMEPMVMSAGEGLMYDHALWHWSPANKTDQLRLAFVVGVVPKEADLVYYQGEGDYIHSFESYREFFFENDRDSGSEKLKLVETFRNEQETLDFASIERIFRS